MRSPRTKRLFDLAISAPALILSLPVQAAIAVAVAVKLGRPVLFRQVRPGLHGEPFELVKFRTMMPIDPAHGRTDDASRMTSLGRTLRSTSLDELPSLWNVVRGDMSVVGPRPLLMQYLSRYSPYEARRHEVKPGLTGLAQISGRNAISWQQKFARDVEYVTNPTFKLDLRIVAATISCVLRRQGVNGLGDATMSEFLGTSDMAVHYMEKQKNESIVG